MKFTFFVLRVSLLMARRFAQLVNFFSQLLNLVLLFLDCVDEHSSQLRVVHAFDLAALVFESQPRVDLGDVFRN